MGRLGRSVPNPDLARHSAEIRERYAPGLNALVGRARAADPGCSTLAQALEAGRHRVVYPDCGVPEVHVSLTEVAYNQAVMARRIEMKGPFRYVLVGLVLAFFAGNWLAPDLWAGLTGKGERSWRLLRSGHVERYHRNLTDHWITAEKGTYRTGRFPALGGEDVVVEFDVDQIEGSVGFRLVRYAWGVWRRHVWSEHVSRDQTGSFRIPVGEAGLYGLELSYFRFAGDVAFDWIVN